MKRKSVPTPPPPRYDEWFRCIFQRPEPLWWNKKIDFTDEYCTLEAQYEFKGTNAEVLDLATYTIANCGRLLAPCSDDDVAEGLFMLFNNVSSNIPHQIMSANKSSAERLPFIAAIDGLYRDLFAQRCKPFLGHLNERAGRLNLACYMLWDTTPLSSWGGIQDEKTGKYPLPETLISALGIPHDACIESALHGLGHMVFGLQKCGDSQTIPEGIDTFLRSTPGLRSELRAYAERAKTGAIQ